MKSVTLFYRDGDNYKCTWKVNLEEDLIEGIELDVDFKSEDLIEIEKLGLCVNDVPLIKIHGFGDSDHNFVSVVKVE